MNAVVSEPLRSPVLCYVTGLSVDHLKLQGVHQAPLVRSPQRLHRHESSDSYAVVKGQRPFTRLDVPQHGGRCVLYFTKRVFQGFRIHNVLRDGVKAILRSSISNRRGVPPIPRQPDCPNLLCVRCVLPQIELWNIMVLLCRHQEPKPSRRARPTLHTGRSFVLRSARQVCQMLSATALRLPGH